MKPPSSTSIRRRARGLLVASRAARAALTAAVDARGSAPPPAWTRVSARGISGDDLSRKALTSPTTVARVGERQFLRDAEEMANAKRRAALAAEKRAIEAAEKARLAAMESENATPETGVTWTSSEDTSAAGLYYS